MSIPGNNLKGREIFEKRTHNESIILKESKGKSIPYVRFG